MCTGRTGKPRVNATDVKPGDESSITDLARLLLGTVGDAANRESPPTPAKGNTPSVNEAITAVLSDPSIKGSTKKEYRRAFEFFRDFDGATRGSVTPVVSNTAGKTAGLGYACSAACLAARAAALLFSISPERTSSRRSSSPRCSSPRMRAACSSRWIAAQ
jgi:hypothetical protein